MTKGINGDPPHRVGKEKKKARADKRVMAGFRAKKKEKGKVPGWYR